MKFSKKDFVEMLKFNDLWALEKGAILPFVQSGNIETSSLTGFELRTLRVTVESLIHYTKSPNRNFFFKFQNNFKSFLQSFCDLE